MEITDSVRSAFEERFIPEPMSGCWLWIGTEFKARGGYGAFFNKELGAKTYRAHRAAWFIYKGPIPDEMGVLHKCDTPACVNPDHLFLGDQKVNMGDARKKGRQAKGDKIPRTKLTPDIVRAIRSDTRGPKVLGALYDITARRVCEIRKRTRWAHVL